MTAQSKRTPFLVIEVSVRFPILPLSFTCACAVRLLCWALWSCLTSLNSRTHMCSDAQIYDMRFSFQLLHSLLTALTHPNGTDVLGPSLLPGARTSWVSGFSPKGGNRLHSDGELAKCSLGKMGRGLPELLTVLAVNLEGGTTRLTLAGFLATRTWGVPFFLKQNLPWGLTVPGAARLSTSGEHQAGTPNCGEGLPFHRRVAPDVSLVRPTVGRMTGHCPPPKKKQPGEGKKKQKRKAKKIAAPICELE